MLIGEPKLAELLWSKTVQPLRSAVLASCMCRRLSKLPHLAPEATRDMSKGHSQTPRLAAVATSVRPDSLAPCLWDPTTGGGSARAVRALRAALHQAARRDPRRQGGNAAAHVHSVLPGARWRRGALRASRDLGFPLFASCLWACPLRLLTFSPWLQHRCRGHLC